MCNASPLLECCQVAYGVLTGDMCPVVVEVAPCDKDFQDIPSRASPVQLMSDSIGPKRWDPSQLQRI